MKKIYFIIILVLPISIFSQENLNLNSNNLNIEFKISPTEFYIKHNSKSKKSLKQKLKTENITELSNNYALVKINNLLNKNNFSKQRIELTRCAFKQY
jgi:hypothetical protein